MTPVIKEKLSGYPKPAKEALAALYDLILSVAKNTDGVGELEETLKWGEPAFLTSASKSGTTIRIDWKARSPQQYALYVSCNSNLIDKYRSLFPDTFEFDGNRAILFQLGEALPEEELRLCIKMALRYHLDKKQ